MIIWQNIRRGQRKKGRIDLLWERRTCWNVGCDGQMKLFTRAGGQALDFSSTG